MGIVYHLIAFAAGSFCFTAFYNWAYNKGWHAGFAAAEEAFIASTKENIAKITKPLFKALSTIESIEGLPEHVRKKTN
jgi:hypothetical protein